MNYLTSYVSEARRLYEAKAREELAPLRETLDDEAMAKAVADYRAANPPPEVTMDDVIDHIDHIRDVGGIDIIGLGADYDGMPPGPVGLEDVSTYPALLAELLRRGYSDEDIAKIAGENVLRAMAQAEAVAKELRASTEPNEALISDLDD